MRQATVLLFAISLSLQANLPAQVLPFHTYTTKEGLLSNRIHTMVQDSRGYLWIGTADGVSVFDGVTFKNYSPADGLTGSYVTSIIESRRSPEMMWIGTLDGGLCRFSHGTFSKINGGMPSMRVLSLMEDREGILWCGTDSAVLQLRDTTASVFKKELILSGVSGIVEANDSLIYILSGPSLLVFSKRSGLVQRVNLGLGAGASLQGFFVDAKSDVWISATDSILYRIHETVLLEKQHIPRGASYPVVLDSDEELWFSGVFRLPLAHLARDQSVHYTRGNGLPGDNVYPLLVDSEHNIWFGSWDNGLIKLAEKDIVRFPTRLYDSRNAVIADDQGRLWGLAFDGIFEYWRDSNGSWHQIRHMIGSPSHPLLHGSTGAFAHGCLWIPCDDGRIRGYRVHASDPVRASSMNLIKTIALQPKAANDNLYIFSDREDFLWCVSRRGLDVVDVSGEPSVVRTLGSPPLPLNAFVNAIWKDRRGNIWIGDYTLGLFLLPPPSEPDGGIRHFTTANGLPDNSVRSIMEDRDGRIWVGTRYGGLAIYDNGTFTTLSMKDGLSSNHIRSMACDSNGTMWLGTSLGPVSIDPRDLSRMGWNNELLGAQVSACGVLPKDFLWFASSTGLTVYQHAKHRPNTQPPPAYVTSFTVNGQPLDIGFPVDLSYQQNSCVIGFVGISLRDENAVRYRYRLKAVDTTWSSPTSQRNVSFASLSPGTYRFEVQAINADGVSSVIPAAVSFTIHPPFWQRWWFIISSALALLIAFGSVVRYLSTQRLQRTVQRLEKERAVHEERERTLERIARDLHDDVASTLGSVVIYSESLKQQMLQRNEPSEFAERIGALSLEAQEAIGDIVWSTSPLHNSLRDVLTRLRDVASEMCTASGIAYDISIQPDLPNRTLSDEVRKSLLLIFKEAMNNIVKHAEASGVRISATVSLGELILSIADDGKGFAVSEADGSARGHGLRNMARRAEEIGSRFSLRSIPGKGTTIEVRQKMT